MKIMRSQLKEFYLDYVNNYLTVAKIAEHNEIAYSYAETLINIGKALHEADIELSIPRLTSQWNLDIKQIKSALDKGTKVYWANKGYEVIKDSIGQYLIHCTMNDTYVGLTKLDGSFRNGDQEQFFMEV